MGSDRSAPAREAPPFGFWPSALSAASVAAASTKRTDLQVEAGSIFVSERRPEEKGRCAIVEHRIGAAQDSALSVSERRDVVSAQRNVRSTAHEYGGACYRVWRRQTGDTAIVFVDHTTHSLVRGRVDADDQAAGELASESTLLERPQSAYADLRIDKHRSRLVCARERHHPQRPEPAAALVAVALDQDRRSEQVLLEAQDLGLDFLTSPRMSPDGSHLAFVGWRHPHMPWDESELFVAGVDDDGSLLEPRSCLGGSGVSVFQPEFGPDGTLYCVSDATGWWNLYRLDQGWLEGEDEPPPARNLTPIEAEFGLPQWVFGMSTYQVPREDLVVAICSENGIWRATRLDPTVEEPRLEELGMPDAAEQQLTFLDSVAADANRVAMLAAGPKTLPLIATWSLDALGEPPELLDAVDFVALDEDSISVGQSIRFDSPAEEVTLQHGPKQRRAHAFYYPPTNATIADRCKPDSPPPLIVKSHGGPTAATSNALDASVQFWTSRGFGLIDVNYAGSTGFGRAYRRLLDGAWGQADVEDCAAAALALVRDGLADPDRLIVRGGSAGGYTTLAALAFTDLFAAGASLYGIGDLEALVRDTHKFESRYLDGLVGKYPEERQTYRDRSPVHAADGLSCPVIFFQGTEDKVVPPNQSESMHAALEAKGVPTEYVLFEGEGHGFRQARNMVQALEDELRFYRTHVLSKVEAPQ